MRPSPRFTSSSARYALAAASFLLTLASFEVAFRIKAWHDDRELDALTGSQVVVSDPRTVVRTKNILRLSHDPRIIYELIPGLHATYKDAVVSTNADGFRGPLVPRLRGDRTVRIAGIGDSVMFGYGVGDGEYYLTLLREKLNEAHPEVAWEIINSAVPGYNTVMEVETLEEKLLAYDPDLVVIEYVGNDLELPNFIRNPAPYFSLTRSYLWTGLFALKRGWSFAPDDRLARPRDDVPAAYADMVGIEAYRRAMTELARLRDEKGFQALVLCHLRCPREVQAIIEELGFPHIDEYEAMAAHLRASGGSMENYLGSDLTRNDEDPHPSPLGHSIIADLVFDALETKGTLEQLVARRSGEQPRH